MRFRVPCSCSNSFGHGINRSRTRDSLTPSWTLSRNSMWHRRPPSKKNYRLRARSQRPPQCFLLKHNNPHPQHQHNPLPLQHSNPLPPHSNQQPENAHPSPSLPTIPLIHPHPPHNNHPLPPNNTNPALTPPSLSKPLLLGHRPRARSTSSGATQRIPAPSKRSNGRLIRSQPPSAPFAKWWSS